MGKFVREISVKAEEGEEAISVRLRPLRWPDLIRIRSGSTEADAVRVYAEVFPSYVIGEPSLPTAADGTPVTLEEFTSAAYFVRLFARVLEQHVEAAQLSDPT